MTPEHAAALARAKARLDRLDLYPMPVRLDGVRVVVAPWFFRLPLLRRYDGVLPDPDDPPAPARLVR